MFRKPLILSVLIVLGSALGSCSGVETSEVEQSCGIEISQDQVTVLDLRPLGSQPELITEFVSERVGGYQLITNQPIGIPVGNWKRVGRTDYIEASHRIEGMEGIGLAQIEAALRGCNLLLVLEQKTVAPKRPGNRSPTGVTVGGEAGGDMIWIVHLGKREI